MGHHGGDPGGPSPAGGHFSPDGGFPSHHHAGHDGAPVGPYDPAGRPDDSLSPSGARGPQAPRSPLARVAGLVVFAAVVIIFIVVVAHM